MKPQFVSSLLALQRISLLAGLDFGTVTVARTLIGIAREELATLAIAEGADRLLWLDVDMTFPPDALDRLLQHDLPVVGANYRMRAANITQSTACKIDGGKSRRIASKRDGLEDVDMMGLGLCLMKAEIFKGLPQPWFSMGEYGEDLFFFQRLVEHKKIRPVVDHALSSQVGHIAETVLML